MKTSWLLFDGFDHKGSKPTPFTVVGSLVSHNVENCGWMCARARTRWELILRLSQRRGQCYIYGIRKGSIIIDTVQPTIAIRGAEHTRCSGPQRPLLWCTAELWWPTA